MCLVAFAWKTNPRWHLVLAGNRDEFHARPAAPLARWEGEPILIGGRDLEAGGTWLGVGAHGRAGVVTNVRDPRASRDGRSRGGLLVDYLRGDASAREQAASISGCGPEYRPFNLVLFDRDAAIVVTNHPVATWRPIVAGVHAISNGAPEADWPKTRRLRAAMIDWLAQDAAPIEDLFAALGDESIAPDAELPDTGVSRETERRLSPAFIRGEEYGTRASTILALAADGAGVMVERRFGPGGRFEGEAREAFFWRGAD